MTSKKVTGYIERKSLLYKTDVEYGDYCLNHVLGCSHGCNYPCYAMMMAKRFGKVSSYEEWIEPKLVINSVELLNKELPKLKDKIKYVHLCFTTDPFMYQYDEIVNTSVELIRILNDSGIKVTALTKGVLPDQLSEFSKVNEFGITLVSLDEGFRKQYEPNTAPFNKRVEGLLNLHKKGLKTWVSIEPYPTPNIIEQDLNVILEKVSFVDKIIFGRLNYNPTVRQYPNYKEFYNMLGNQVIDFCTKKNIDYHIKEGTIQ